MIEHRSSKIGIVAGLHRRHQRDILRHFFLINFHRVVKGDDPDHAVFRVHNRNGNQPVFLEQLGDFLLIVVSPHGNDMRFHQVADQGVLVVEQQAFRCNDT